MSSVEVTHLSVKAGSTTLISDVTLDIEPGTWCTIIGPNGAGKTTLVETIAGLRPMASGSVTISGQSIADLNERERARLVSVVAQHPQVPAGMTVRDYVALGRVAFHGVLRAPSAGDERAVDDEESYLIEHGFIDLAPLAHDAILLDLPLAPLCRPDCQGLCPYCGGDLNDVACDCQAPLDSRWATLDGLQFADPESSGSTDA